MHIRHRVERFLSRHELSATRFGRLAVGDPNLVSDLRAGREPRAPLRSRIEHFMNMHEETHA